MRLKLAVACTIALLAFWLPAARLNALPPALPPLPLGLAGFPAQPDGSAALPPVSYITPAGQLGGSTQAVAVQGSQAYIGDGPRMLVLDISDPALPVQLGRTPPLNNVVQNIAVVGNLAYVIEEHEGLHVFDVTRPADPVEIGGYDTPGQARMVAVSGALALVADYWDGLQVIDVTNPRAPHLLGSLDTPGAATGVVVAGGLAYVSDLDGGLRIIDVGDPAHPVEIGYYDTPGDAWGLDVAGHRAYVADTHRGLRIIDVSDPAHPVEVGAYTGLSSVVGVAVRGTSAYLADWWSGLHIIDVSNPAAPHELGVHDTPAYALKLAVQAGPTGVTVYVADGDGGLRIVDVTDPTQPREVGFHNTLGHALSTAAAGSLIYVAGGFSGLRVIDARDPEQPREIGQYATGQEDCAAVVLAGNNAYLGTNGGGLHILDIRVPTTPTRIGYLSLAGGAHDVAVVGRVAYTASEYGGLRIVDIGDPAHPREVGALPVPGARAVAVRGTIAYVAAGRAGLALIDITDSAHPELLSLTATPSEAWDVAVAGRFAYVGNWAGYDGARVFDVTDPRQPAEYPPIAVPGGVFGMALGMPMRDGTPRVLYAAGDGLAVIDLVDPAHPIMARYTPGGAQGVTVVGSTAYLADHARGLNVLRLLRDRQEATITPEGGSLTAADTSLTAVFQPGAFTETVRLAYERLAVDEDTGVLQGIGQTYRLSARSVESGQPAALAPGKGYALVVSYLDAELGPLDESTLGLRFREDSRWLIEPTASLHADSNAITAFPHRLGWWAVLGRLPPRAYLPLMLHGVD